MNHHNGLVLNAGDSTVCGLVLNRLFNAIQANSSDNRIEGNFIASDVAGAAALANESVGIVIFSGARNHVDRNVISGNRGYGLILEPVSSENVIRANHFGTNATGMDALPNGGLAEATRNIIAGNVLIGEPSKGAVVQGNYFGTDETGTRALESIPPSFLVSGLPGKDRRVGRRHPRRPCTGGCNVLASVLNLGAPFGEDGNNVVRGDFVGRRTRSLRRSTVTTTTCSAERLSARGAQSPPRRARQFFPVAAQLSPVLAPRGAPG